MKARSIQGPSAGDIQNALKTSMADSFKPMPAVVFIVVKQDNGNPEMHNLSTCCVSLKEK